MTRYTPLWLQPGSYAGSVDRRLIGALWPGPASSGGAVTPALLMTLNVAPATIAVPTQNNTGSTLCVSDGTEQVTLTNAPASGNRYDLVICQPRGNDLDGGANNDFIFTYVTGVATASPAVPVAPAGSVAIAQIYVPGGSASVTAGNITDIRPWGLATWGSTLRPPPVTTGSTVQVFTDPDGETWVAKNGVNGGVWSRLRVIKARMYRNGAWTTANNTTLGFDSASFDPYGCCNLTTGVFTCPVAADYLVMTQFGWVSSAANQGGRAQITKQGNLAIAAGEGAVSVGAGNLMQSLTFDLVPCLAGDQLYTVQVSIAAGLTGVAGSIQTYTTIKAMA